MLDSLCKIEFALSINVHEDVVEVTAEHCEGGEGDN